LLEVLQNTKDLQFHLGAKTLALLQREFNIPLNMVAGSPGFGQSDCQDGS